MKKAKYLIENYRDEYNTLHQEIMIDLDENKQTNGETLRFARSRINPNLTILYRTEHWNKNHKVLDIQQLINDEWVELDVNTLKPIED
jgi:hypothetical protein